MKAFFVAALSMATVLSSVPVQALDSHGFDSRGNCRLSQGCVSDGVDGDTFHEPRNYRDFNGRKERNDRSGSDRNERRYRIQNRTDILGDATSRVAAVETVGGIVALKVINA